MPLPSTALLLEIQSKIDEASKDVDCLSQNLKQPLSELQQVVQQLGEQEKVLRDQDEEFEEQQRQAAREQALFRQRRNELAEKIGRSK
jgi:peptidoglycan hydrolase CwlO-like protein